MKKASKKASATQAATKVPAKRASTKKTSAKQASAKPAKKPLAAIRRSATAAGAGGSPRTEVAEHFATQHAATTAAVEKAIRRAMPALHKATKGQQLYAFAVYTSGTSHFSYAQLSANTEAGLDAVARDYLGRSPASTHEHERAALRWNPCDWKHHGLARVTGTRIGALVAIRSRAEDAAIWEAFAAALERCDRAGLFGVGEARERIALAILCGDMDARFLMKGVRRLNPPAVVARVQREWRAGA